MKLLLRIGVFGVLAVGFSQGLLAQRGGGGGGHMGGGGGFHGGGGTGGSRGGTAFGGGMRGGFNGGFRGGFGSGRTFNNGRSFAGRGFVDRDRFGRGFFGNGFFGGFGLGAGYISPYFGYWDDPYLYDYGYPAYTSGYSGPVEYNPSPNVTVVYPATTAPVYAPPVQPVMRTYDQYGQETRPQGDSAAAAPAENGSPLYLIASKDGTIHAAAAYWVDGKTLHYITLQHEEKQAPLDSVDRAFSAQLNRERRVAFQLPQ